MDSDPHRIKNYIASPQIAGYRAIHVPAEIVYDRVANAANKSAMVVPERILCEIQIRTKLQDAWADVTHEFFYKAKNFGVVNKTYESFLADLSERLSVEDKSFIKFREAYKDLADEKQKRGRREGFRAPLMPKKALRPTTAKRTKRPSRRKPGL